MVSVHHISEFGIKKTLNDKRISFMHIGELTYILVLIKEKCFILNKSDKKVFY